MKHIIFFLFTTLSVVATAQEATKDSSVIISKNGLFFTVRYQEFANGESSVVTTLLGDTPAIIGKNSEEIRNKTSSWASDIEWQSIGALGTALSIRAKLNLLAENSVETINQSVFDSAVFDNNVFDGNGSIQASGQNIPLIRFNQFQVILEHGAAVG